MSYNRVTLAQWSPNQLSALQLEFNKGFESLPARIGAAVLARLDEAMPGQDWSQGKVGLPLGQLALSVVGPSAQEVQCVYPFLRQAYDFVKTTPAVVSRSGICESVLLTVSSKHNFAEYEHGSAITCMPVNAGYWIPSVVVEELDSFTGTGHRSSLRHYFRMALLACENLTDYNNTGSLARKLTGANLKQNPPPDWVAG